jgi:hypothetical protein
MFKPLRLIAPLSVALTDRADTATNLTLPVLDADLRATLSAAFFIDGVLDIPVGVFGVTPATP